LKDESDLRPYTVGMDDVELRELRYFIAVAEELSFTRAAARLGMAQPPLSSAIGKLERKLGVTLLERTSRHVALTSAGTLLLEQGRIAIEGVGAAIERARRKGARPDCLTVAIKPGTGTELLAKILRLCAQDPQIPEVRLRFEQSGGPAAALRSGAVDVAILRTPFDQRGLDTELLMVEPRVAVLPKSHRLAGRRVLRRADLLGEPIPRWAGQHDPAAAEHWAGLDTPLPHGATVSDGAIPQHPGRNECNDRHAGTPQGPEINDMNQLLDAVALGNAVAYVPISMTNHDHRPELAFIPVSDLSPSLVVAAWPDTCHSRAVAGFIRRAIEVASDHTAAAVARASK